MMLEHVEQDDNRNDFIITRSFLTRSDMMDRDQQKIYDCSTLQKLVNEPILDLCFQTDDPDTENQPFRKMVTFGQCTKSLTQDAKAFTCYDSASDVSKYICEE
ncbi:hypothetical protein RF11_13674 [Thelohanellus kitauei]|uniref:Uncharacterized protein n=1 Tax=Thelohanellus kitauei TaxID=669202 RepID=A0A0C2M5A1_THEKT|nr:hypothetical protein RF11_13674 [Thelohanellus kitauei]